MAEVNQILIGIAIFTPLVGAVLSWPLDQLKSRLSAFLGVFTISMSAIASFTIFILISIGNWEDQAIQMNYWLIHESYNIGIKLSPDALGAFIAMIASFLGMLIALFSIRYMEHDKFLTRYWVYLQAFIFGMVALVIAGDLISMYIGWEMVGLCSFGLISHYHYKAAEDGEKAGQAGIKAFIFTRIGDVGFLVAIVLIYKELGTIYLDEIASSSPQLTSGLVTSIGLFFILAALGKSAQFPFIPWLSSPERVDIDAMQGPTTVSALIHAATMVKAGVYLIARMYIILPVQSSEILGYSIIIIAGITALIAAMSALVSVDIKRILAYSTVSQLAYMFLILGIAYLNLDTYLQNAAFISGIYHLFSHGIFKSLLFLSAGYVIHHVGSRNIYDLQGVANWNANPFAFIGFVAGIFSLVGIPPFIGFFSKEPLIGTLFSVYNHSQDSSLNAITLFAYVVAVITALVTAMYGARLLFYMLQPNRVSDRRHHTSLDVMSLILLILSIFTITMMLVQLILPSYFKTLLNEAHLHPLDENIWHTIILTMIILGMFILSYQSQHWTEFHGGIRNNRIMKPVIIAAREGFYLEAFWSNSWKVLKGGSFAFRRSHTGKVNDMVLVSTLVATIMLVTIIGG